MNTLFRVLNTLLLAGILTVLILVFRGMPREPVAVEGSARSREPVQVEITR